MRNAELTDRIIRGFYRSFNNTPRGLLERPYQGALLIELERDGLVVESEVPIELLYRGRSIGDYRLDLVVGYSVIVECKAVSAITPSHRQQLRGYLAATGLRVGLLLNFGPAPQVARVDYERETDRSRLFEFRRRDRLR